MNICCGGYPPPPPLPATGCYLTFILITHFVHTQWWSTILVTVSVSSFIKTCVYLNTVLYIVTIKETITANTSKWQKDMKGKHGKMIWVSEISKESQMNVPMLHIYYFHQFIYFFFHTEYFFTRVSHSNPLFQNSASTPDLQEASQRKWRICYTWFLMA